MTSLSDYVENHYQLAVTIVALASLVISFLCCTAQQSSDFWAHLNWMKITHRLPLRNWYDHGGDYQLDYPPLEAYIHYCMGFIYSLVDPYTLQHTDLHTAVPVSAPVKYGLRLAVIVVAVIFYYPAVICFVSWYYTRLRNYLKVFLIALLLNMPVFTQIEHMNTQVNAPTLGFLIWALYFVMSGRFSLCAMFFGLSMLCKQITIPSILPIGFYIVSALYAEGRELQRRKEAGSWVPHVLVNGLKLVVVGLVTIGIVMAPFWNKPETLKAMMERMFPVEKRELITTAATLWTFLRSYFRPIDIAQNRLMLFRMCSAMVTLSSALTLPFVLRRPRNNSVFLAAFAVCGMNTYLFGYYIHEKHLQYAYLAFLLNFVVFRRFLSIFSFVISYTLFYMGSINNNHVECLILTFSFMYMMRSFENEVRKEAKESQRLPALEDSHASALDRLVFWAYRGQARYSDHVLAGIFVALALVGAMGLTCLFIRPLRDFLEANSFYFMFDGPFLCFVYIYIFMWKALYVESTRPEEGYEPVKLK